MTTRKKLARVESDLPTTPVIIPVEAYTCPEYAREERDKLWAKVWQVACREEEIPNVGDYVTYDILDQSVIVVRSAPGVISAYQNVCMHRGRRLTKGCGNTGRFTCKFHGWQWNLRGENVHVIDPQDWDGAICAETIRLPDVQVGTWGGYVFINLDPDCESLDEYLEPVRYWLDPFQIDKMRYRWRQWLYYPCNWKVALEAFNEAYHVPTTHPQIVKYGLSDYWSRAHGKHGVMGVGRVGEDRAGGTTASIPANAAGDPRKLAAEYMQHLWDTLNACTTKTIVDAARRLVDLLPEDAPGDVVGAKMVELAAEMDAERGVIWPKVDPEHMANSGIDWHIFPNTVILHGLTHALCYRARPNGFDPDSCIFEVYVLERFPEGQEPRPENVYQPEMTQAKWGVVLPQDFNNMSEVQAGMKSLGFPGTVPSPHQEQSVIGFHRALAAYMGRGAPEPIKR